MAIDTSLTLNIDGTAQRLRLCAARSGLPPILIVQAGPGLPVLNEVGKFQQRLNLEQSYTVCYWDQRGCGKAPQKDTREISLETQVQDVCAVIRRLAEQTGQQLVILAISLGATFALQAAEREAAHVKAFVAVSIDTDIPASDAAVVRFLQEASLRPENRKLAQSLAKLGAPPYTDPKLIQLRARLPTDLGGIEYGKRFGELVRAFLGSLVRTYGVFGTVATFRNINGVQRKLLPQLAKFEMFAHWPQTCMPVHYIFGGRDPLNPPSLVKRVSAVITQRDTVVTLPNAGHMAHFDEPDTVRNILAQAVV